MNIRVAVSSLAEGELCLAEDAARYVARVHRLGVGDRFLAFDPEARTEADVEITDVARGVRGRAGPVRPAAAVATAGTVLLQGIGKGDKPEQVIRDATALGASRVIFVESRRSVVRVGDRAEARRHRWRAVAVSAARQSGRGDLPGLEGPMTLEAALATLTPVALKLYLSPSATTRLADALGRLAPGDAVALLVGPEGGFDDAEVATASEHGFVPVALGRFVLRTETAAVAALGAIAALGPGP
jgi:16S rRNA (uracil1498-N3)-methyltransferase